MLPVASAVRTLRVLPVLEPASRPGVVLVGLAGADEASQGVRGLHGPKVASGAPTVGLVQARPSGAEASAMRRARKPRALGEASPGQRVRQETSPFLGASTAVAALLVGAGRTTTVKVPQVVAKEAVALEVGPVIGGRLALGAATVVVRRRPTVSTAALATTCCIVGQRMLAGGPVTTAAAACEGLPRATAIAFVAAVTRPNSLILMCITDFE